MTFWGSLRARLVRVVAGDVIAREVEVVRATVQAAADERVREAASSALSRDDQKNLEQGFRRLTSSANVTHPIRDLQPLRQDQMLRLVYWLWESNPIAKWLIETPVDFILGEGATVKSENEDVQAAIDEFWDDAVNQLDRRLDTFTREFRMYGELCLPVAVNEVDGRVRIAYVDPFDIDRVITDPNNVLVNVSVLLKSRAAGEPGRLLKVVREETARASSYAGLMMPALPLERCPVEDRAYDGSCLLFQTNKVSNARRGRSDIVTDIDWLDGYDQYLFDTMDAAALFNSFVWDAKLEGMTPEQIKQWLTEFRKDLKRGGVFAHNEKVTLDAVTPDLKALDKDQFARLFRGHILGGHSMPEHWYGLAGEVNLASAKEMGLPPVKRLTRKQKELRFVIGDMVRFQLHQKIRVGVLKKTVVIGRVDADGSSKGTTVPTDKAFTITLPELSMRDTAAIVAALTSLGAALIEAQQEGWVRPETAAKLFANMASQLGEELDPKREFTPGAGPAGDRTKDYSPANLQQMLERLQAQLGRQGNGNGDNVNEDKRTTPQGGQVREAQEFAERVVRTVEAAYERGQAATVDAVREIAHAIATQPAPVVNVHAPEPATIEREYVRDEKNLVTGHVDRPVKEPR